MLPVVKTWTGGYAWLSFDLNTGDGEAALGDRGLVEDIFGFKNVPDSFLD